MSLENKVKFDIATEEEYIAFRQLEAEKYAVYSDYLLRQIEAIKIEMAEINSPRLFPDTEKPIYCKNEYKVWRLREVK